MKKIKIVSFVLIEMMKRLLALKQMLGFVTGTRTAINSRGETTKNKYWLTIAQMLSIEHAKIPSKCTF